MRAAGSSATARLRLATALSLFVGCFVVEAGEGHAGAVPSRIAVSPIQHHRFEAPRDAIGFGTSVGAGDFNGDGVPDFVIGGSPTFIYSGADHSLLLTIPGGAGGFGLEIEV